MRVLLAVLLLLACGDDGGSSSDDGSAGASASAGASELEICKGAADCIFGSTDPDGDAFTEVCVADGVFATASAACRACMLSLTCDELEAAIDGDTAAQAKCMECT